MARSTATPQLEYLEDRTAPAQYNWTGLGSTDWTNTINWSVEGDFPDAPPTIDDVVAIDSYYNPPRVPAAGATVGALYMVQGTLYLDGNLTIDGQFDPPGGTLLGDVVFTGDNGTLLIKDYPANNPAGFGGLVAVAQSKLDGTHIVALRHAHAYNYGTMTMQDVDSLWVGWGGPGISEFEVRENGDVVIAGTTTNNVYVNNGSTLTFQGRVTPGAQAGLLKDPSGGVGKVTIQPSGRLEFQGSYTGPGNLIDFDVDMQGQLDMLAGSAVEFRGLATQLRVFGHMTMRDSTTLTFASPFTGVYVEPVGVLEIDHALAGTQSTIDGGALCLNTGNVEFAGEPGHLILRYLKINDGLFRMRIWEYANDKITIGLPYWEGVVGFGEAYLAALDITVMDPLPPGYTYLWDLFSVGYSWWGEDPATCWTTFTVNGYEFHNYDLIQENGTLWLVLEN